METLEHIKMEQLISESFKNSMSYDAYRQLISNLVKTNSTTGNDKSEAMINYTALNERRMKRWDKTVKLTDEASVTIKSFDKKIIWLVISESWCGDAAHILPVINKVAMLNDNIELKIVLRDQNNALMDRFLTNGGKAIPKLIMLDAENKDVLGTFGPRPTVPTQMVLNYKKEHGQLTPEFKEDLQRWYNKDKGQSTIKDLTKLLK